MRMTIRLEDDLLQEIKRRAAADKLSITEAINRVLRRGLAAPKPKRAPFPLKAYNMGPPKVNLDKALGIAAALEDEETIREMAEGR